MGNKYTGGCFCGQIRYEISSEPKSVVHCHCNHCKRSIGGPFVTWAIISLKNLEYVHGSPAIHLTNHAVERGFCSQCGSSISYFRIGEDTIDITVGTFDNPNSVKPLKHIWDSKRIQWVKMNDALPHYEEWSKNQDAID